MSQLNLHNVRTGASAAGSTYSQNTRMEPTRYQVTPPPSSAAPGYYPIGEEASQYSTSSHVHHHTPVRDDPLRQSM